jgi:hypothetical protein
VQCLHISVCSRSNRYLCIDLCNTTTGNYRHKTKKMILRKHQDQIYEYASDRLGRDELTKRFWMWRFPQLGVSLPTTRIISCPRSYIKKLDPSSDSHAFGESMIRRTCSCAHGESSLPFLRRWKVPRERDGERDGQRPDIERGMHLFICGEGQP